MGPWEVEWRSQALLPRRQERLRGAVRALACSAPCGGRGKLEGRSRPPRQPQAQTMLTKREGGTEGRLGFL